MSLQVAVSSCLVIFWSIFFVQEPFVQRVDMKQSSVLKCNESELKAVVSGSYACLLVGVSEHQVDLN